MEWRKEDEDYKTSRGGSLRAFSFATMRFRMFVVGVGGGAASDRNEPSAPRAFGVRYPPGVLISLEPPAVCAERERRERTNRGAAREKIRRTKNSAQRVPIYESS